MHGTTGMIPPELVLLKRTNFEVRMESTKQTSTTMI